MVWLCEKGVIYGVMYLLKMLGMIIRLCVVGSGLDRSWLVMLVVLVLIGYYYCV